MDSDALEQFEKMLAAGKDSAMLRFSLGNGYLKTGEPARAVPHLRRAVELDPGYSAAWKLLGRSLYESGDDEHAAEAYQTGISVAQRKGDVQAAKEMQVFLRRVEKRRGAG